MTKAEAISIFGSGAELARALGITRGAVSQWPDVLPQRDVDAINGAALRLGKISSVAVRTELPEAARAAV